MKRVEPFTMERDVLNIGDRVSLTEGVLPRSYYYTAEPAAAMSRNFPKDRRIISREGTVVSKTEDGGGTFTIEIEFDEPS